MLRSLVCAVAACLFLGSTAHADTFIFNTDPFAGSTALTTPGRQIVGGEASISFNVATDVFALDPAVFGTGANVLFANDIAANLPTGGVNAIVLRSLDNDGDVGTPFGAGNAANLIASQLTSPGAGFFVYFNQGLGVPRLVYSTDLNDNTADLKILFRLTNLTADALQTFTASNFTFGDAPTPVPEPSMLLLVGIGALGVFRRATTSR